MDPLEADGELEEEGAEEEGEEVLDLAVREVGHDETEGVAGEETESVGEGVVVEADGIGEGSDVSLDEGRDWEGWWTGRS